MVVFFYGRHQQLVTAWLKKAGRGLTSAQLADLVENAIAAIWVAARVSVNDVTLTAILDRTLVNAADAFPWLPELPLGENTVDASALREPGFPKARAVKAVEHVVTDFIAIIGNMTAETLSPILHEELRKVQLGSRPDAPGE